MSQKLLTTHINDDMVLANQDIDFSNYEPPKFQLKRGFFSLSPKHISIFKGGKLSGWDDVRIALAMGISQAAFKYFLVNDKRIRVWRKANKDSLEALAISKIYEGIDSGDPRMIEKYMSAINSDFKNTAQLVIKPQDAVKKLHDKTGMK